LEAGPSLDILIQSLYTALIKSFEQQIPDLSERNSLRLALKEVSHLYSAAMNADRGGLSTKPRLLEKVLGGAALHPVEIEGHLLAQSSDALDDSGFNVLVGPAAEDAARFLDWLPKPKGLLTLLQDGGLLRDAAEETKPLLGGQQALFAYGDLLWNHFEPSALRLLERETSLYLTFETKTGRWIHLSGYSEEVVHHYQKINEILIRSSVPQLGQYRAALSSRFCIDKELSIAGLEQTDAIFVGPNCMFLPGSKFAAVAERIFARLSDRNDATVVQEQVMLLTIADRVSGFPLTGESLGAFTEGIAAWADSVDKDKWIEADALFDLVMQLPSIHTWTASSAWQRRGDAE
jgi:molecular chaperone HtpG